MCSRTPLLQEQGKFNDTALLAITVLWLGCGQRQAKMSSNSLAFPTSDLHRTARVVYPFDHSENPVAASLKNAPDMTKNSHRCKIAPLPFLAHL